MESQPPILAEPLSSLRDYLERFPDDWDDGTDRQLEVVDGQPVVTASPTGPHQLCVMALSRLLHGSCRPGWVVVPAPWDWVLWEGPRLQLRQPDLVVVTREQALGARLTVPPLLAVEVVSGGSFERDIVSKRKEYARAGLQHTWVVDPSTARVVVYQQSGGGLRIVHRVADHDELHLEEPLAVTIRPTDLVG